MFGELEPETLLCVSNPLHGGQRNLELAIAKGADSNGGNLTNPFHHPKIAFWHGQPCPMVGKDNIRSGRRVRYGRACSNYRERSAIAIDPDSNPDLFETRTKDEEMQMTFLVLAGLMLSYWIIVV